MTENSPQPRQHPIPPPSHPRQSRAIGIVYGQYYPSDEAQQRGALVTADGSMVESVLLGRIFSVVKKHVDLNASHFWLVYPRQRDKDDHLHFQIMGIWEPQQLGRGDLSIPQTGHPPTPQTDHAYFSIRGEVIFASTQKKLIIIKIRQSPRPNSKRPRFLKVKIQGVLSNPDGSPCERPLRHFWDLQVTLQQNQLILEQCQDLGSGNRRGVKRRPKSSAKPIPKSNNTTPSAPKQRDRKVFRLPRLKH